MPKKLLMVGGGTGGHVFPLLNLAKYLRRVQIEPPCEGERVRFTHSFPARQGGCTLDSTSRPSTSSGLGWNDEQIQFHWIGESKSIESKVSGENAIPFSPIICGKLRRYFSLKTLLLPFQIIIGIIQSLIILKREKPDAIFSKGGYVSLPVAIAGRMLSIPIYLHESDSIPGLANRFVARFTTGIFTAFPEADSFFKGKVILGHGPLLSTKIETLQNNPLLEGGSEIQNENRGIYKKINPPSSSNSDTSFKKEVQTQLLISCGSQGSSSIFDAVLDILPTIPEIDVHVILGVKNLDYRSKFEHFPNVTIYDFFYDQTEYLRVVEKCDLVIARSGSSIFEFEALGLHMILIPHPHTGNNHQYWNAKAFVKKGHDIILQENLKKELPVTIEKYKHFKKSHKNGVVDTQIFHTIAKTLFQK